MQINNQVTIVLQDQRKIIFTTEKTILQIQSKYAPGLIFIKAGAEFITGVISSMTCESLTTKN